MFILGLTGSIGMGKSTVASMFEQLGAFVHDADRTVHELMAPGGAAVEPVIEIFPKAKGRDGIDRKALGAEVFGNPDALRCLERILHPLVRQSETRFLAMKRRQGARLIILDIPLLFETKGEERCDAVAVIHCRAFLQQQRVMRRPDMTIEKLNAIRAQQMPVLEKCKRADFVIETGLSKAYTFAQVQRVTRAILRRAV